MCIALLQSQRNWLKRPLWGQVCRVYVGSFNGSQPIREDINPQCKPLFEKEQADLLRDLTAIPARAASIGSAPSSLAAR